MGNDLVHKGVCLSSPLGTGSLESSREPMIPIQQLELGNADSAISKAISSSSNNNRANQPYSCKGSPGDQR